MLKQMTKFISPTWNPVRAALAGLLATIAYSVAMEGDMSLTGNRFSDVRFIEGMLPREKSVRKGIPVLAWVLHLLNGVALGEVYAALFERFLPGPKWVKGAIFSEGFIIAAWGLTPLADKYHPFIKSGELPKLANWTSFLQNIVRHLVFGITLGLFYNQK
ncbi:MAG TPA: DUF6789 family protein [Ktedonobacteraceae bacterium]|jgi:hypothetical protein|nr:DUF6789 family protein [Ktedonobacteraceae bacterium]